MYERNCPECGEKLKYKSKLTFRNAINKNNNCRSCATKKSMSDPNVRKRISESLKGHSVSNETRIKISEKSKGISRWKNGFSEEHRNKIKEKRKFQEFSKKTCEKMSKKAKLRIGNKNPFYGKKHSNETRKKIRLSLIETLKKRYALVFPNYNISSIPILKNKAKELGIVDLQHAENGGELYIKELGYWVDGYSKEKNTVIEYYEKRHLKQIEKDKQRKQEIMNLLNCKFIEIKEWE